MAHAAQIAGLALIAGLAFGANAASAAAPTVSFSPVDAEYTTAEITATIESPGAATQTAWQYAVDPDTEGWTDGPNPPYGPNSLLLAAGTHTVTEVFPNLNPDTTYQARLVISGPFGSSGESESLSYPEPTLTFTTKPVAAPVVTFDPITAFGATTAHFSGTVDDDAPAGPLSPVAEAAYKTRWHFECTPQCLDPSGAPYGGVVEAGEGGQTVSANVTHLEANTFYEVRLVASNALTTTVERSVQLPLVPPSVRAAAGASDGKGGYTLQGVINRHNSKVTDCHFEYGPTTAYLYEAPCFPTPTGRDAVQKLQIVADAGHFKLSFQGQATADLPFDATAAEVEAGLEALSMIGPGGVEVSYVNEALASDYEITFTGPLSERNVGELHLIDNTTSGGGASSGLSNVSVAVVGGDNLPIVVEAPLTGLTPNATYHFRIVATNGAGTADSGDRVFVPTLAADEGSCPKETIRAENNSLRLPECRAYEMVTSPFKGGFAAAIAPVEYTDDGSAFTYRSGGVFAGIGLSQTVNTYLASRSDAGWKTTTYSASAPAYAVAGGPVDMAANLQASLNLTRRADQPSNIKDFYLRGQDGSFTRIGPGVNPAKLPPADPGPMGTGSGLEDFVGASADLSHVVYEIEAPAGTFPGDTTQREQSLYEYVGTGHDRPRLVGVDNSGQVVSDCGTVAGAPRDKFNAVSRDGRVIFFAALRGSCGSTSLPATEVWARVDGASSYEVSESQCTRTSADPGGACNSPANAAFAGASADGSRVYFTTTQQLVNGDTDEANDLYGYDLPSASDPSPSPALVEVSGSSDEARVEGVARVSDDGSRVYFVAKGAALATNADAFGEPAHPGNHNLYVWHRDTEHPGGQTNFVARLSDDYVPSETTPDGRYLLLYTKTPLVETDTDNAEDVYRYDAGTAEMLRVSTATSGTGGDLDGFDATFLAASSEALPTAARRPRWSISANGAAVIFRTAEGLSPLDVNGAPDVYLWKAGHVSLISGGQWPEGISTIGTAYIDGSGDNIYFSTSEPITPADADTAIDFYDARVGGGFSFARPGPCLEEACRPAPSRPPPAPLAATDRPRRAGNVKASALSVRVLTRSDRAKLARGGRVQLKVKVSRPGKVIVDGTVKIDGEQRQAFFSTLTTSGAGEVKLPISLSKRAQGQLRSRGSLTVRVSVRFAGAAPRFSKLKLTR